MKSKTLLGITVVIAIIVIGGYFAMQPKTQTDTEASIANPASVYCHDQGFQEEIITAADGSQSSDCVAPSGARCDAWAFYRGECTLA